MEDPVQSRFPRREQKARATRRAVLAAARASFVELGYGATTMQTIADRSDVAVQTVYGIFGNKRSILAEVLDVAIAGDDVPVAVNDREWMRPVWEAPTAEERLRAYAGAVRRIMEGAGDVFAVVAAAATVSSDVVDLANTTEQRRRLGAESVIRSVRSVGTLRADLTVGRAVDVLWLLNGPLVYRHLVRDAGWSLARYERWLADAMVVQLLAAQPGGRTHLGS